MSQSDQQAEPPGALHYLGPMYRRLAAELDQLDFEAARRRFVAGCCTLRERLEAADARTAFDGHASLTTELRWLASKLGCRSVPMLVETFESEQGVTVAEARFPPRLSGLSQNVLVAAYARNQQDFSGRRVALSDADREAIICRLREWERYGECAHEAAFCATAITGKDIARACITEIEDIIRVQRLPSTAVYEAKSATSMAAEGEADRLDDAAKTGASIRPADAPGVGVAANTHIIKASVASQRYEVSTGTIGRRMRHGDFTDHRPPNHAKGAPLVVDEREIAAAYRRRPEFRQRTTPAK